ncbi:MAG: cyclic nucleotide-binding domain-containing protein [Treponema sp.]|nr:cyclic nucleotide-binding domain-containing protein [Treponema sp.]
MRRAAKSAAALRKVGILQDLSDEELERVLAIAEPLEVKSGTVIMREDEPGDEVFLFMEGRVDVSKNLTLKIGRAGFGRAEKSMTKLTAGQASVFGEMALFGTEPRSATVTASSDCLLYRIRREDFSALCESNPALGLKVVRRIAAVLGARVRKGNEDILKLSTALSIALSK